LGGVETLVFTGGIGERAAPVRWEICQGLAHLGIRLDPGRNAEDSETIGAPPGACTDRVIPTNEDLMIARHTRAVLRSPSARSTRRMAVRRYAPTRDYAVIGDGRTVAP